MRRVPNIIVAIFVVLVVSAAPGASARAETASLISDPSRYWPDPVGEVPDLGVEERFYGATRPMVSRFLTGRASRGP